MALLVVCCVKSCMSSHPHPIDQTPDPLIISAPYYLAVGLVSPREKLYLHPT